MGDAGVTHLMSRTSMHIYTVVFVFVLDLASRGNTAGSCHSLVICVAQNDEALGI